VTRPRRSAVLLTAALLLLGIACWNPTIEIERPVVDAVVVFDISQSMDVTDARIDGRRVSRLDLAKAALRRTLGELPCGSRIGLGVFSEYRILLLTAPAEVCAGHADLVALLDRIDNRLAWTNGSEIRKGVLNAREAALALPGKPALVFVTDGQEAPPLAPGQGRHFDGKPGEVRGLLIGVGGDLPQPIPKHDRAGQSLGVWGEREVVQVADDATSAAGTDRRAGTAEQLSALREPYLIRLAGEIGVDYRRLDGAEALAAMLADAQLMHAISTEAPLGDGFAGAALVLLLIAAVGGRVRAFPFG